jgi:DNA polymerase-3 subunit epsilon
VPRISMMGKTLCEVVETCERIYTYGLVFDTETLGKEEGEREIVEITVMRPWDKRVVYTSLVRPTRPIPVEAMHIHGITDEMVADAPRWNQIHDEVLAVLTSTQYVSTYGAYFDTAALEETAGLYRLKIPYSVQFHCAMRAYPRLYGGPWRKLAAACEERGIEFDLSEAHRAEYDTRKTCELIGEMALC